ncbi:GLPGLI family protein [Runella aurantiaca]|uniref:GLPGLI family protein n=1 Tax=Runella aurantiaca TaxID=2282308 RepID=A0A369I7Y5_9BACT|nr:GLPGLI family protein [Runella aurantiaca]RDB05879.1 GLPGLI family protein [Runella aurantiaca]
MKDRIFIVFLIWITYSVAFCQTIDKYKVTYRVTYIPELISKITKTELAFLVIEKARSSIYGTENLFKQDSIRRLIREQKITPQEVMNNRYPKTGFQSFVSKQYADKTLQVIDKIGVDSYFYTQANELIWSPQPDTLTIQKYMCQKANTTYEGRNYTAWYTTEIPISDGPYKFWGLPGLIVQVYDSEKHYIFSLESLEKYVMETLPTLSQANRLFNVSFDKYKSLKKESLKNPLKTLEQGGFRVGNFNGAEAESQLKEKQVNPIEKY